MIMYMYIIHACTCTSLIPIVSSCFNLSSKSSKSLDVGAAKNSQHNIHEMYIHVHACTGMYMYTSLVPRLSPCAIFRPLKIARRNRAFDSSKIARKNGAHSFVQFSMCQRSNDCARGEPGDEASAHVHVQYIPRTQRLESHPRQFTDCFWCIARPALLIMSCLYTQNTVWACPHLQHTPVPSAWLSSCIHQVPPCTACRETPRHDHMHTHMHARTRTCTHTHTHTHTHTRMHAHTHTRTRTDTCIVFNAHAWQGKIQSSQLYTHVYMYMQGCTGYPPSHQGSSVV